MRVAEVAKRYAKALFEIGKENNSAEAYLKELQAVAKIFLENPGLNKFAISPLVMADEKRQVLEKALETASASDQVRAFLLVLTQKGRLPLLQDVMNAYQSQMDQDAGVVRGQVKTAHGLNDQDQKEVIDLLSKMTNSDVVLEFDEEPELVAGLTAQVGSLNIDDSIQSHLNRMRDELNRSVN